MIKVYDSEVVLCFGAGSTDVGIVPQSGVSIAVSYWNGVNYTDAAESPITQPDTLFVSDMIVKLSPTGGGFAIGGDGSEA